MRPLNAVIIDDEQPARSRLKRLLDKYKESIQVLGEADNGVTGAQLVNENKPDIIFLDVEMPGLNGFEMLKQLNYHPSIVFTTAYEEYALNAFEENSIDYLLKPIEEDRLEKTIQKINRNKENTSAGSINLDAIAEVLNNLSRPTNETITSIPVKKGDKTIIIKLSDVVFLEAKEKYVFVNTIDEREHLIDLSLSYLETKLPEHFKRVHRSQIVNTAYIKEVQKYFDGKYVLLLNDKKNTKVVTGASYGKEIKRLIDL